MKEGLKMSSPPVWQSAPERWIYVSAEPWYPNGDDTDVIFQVDLSFLEPEECGWPFIDTKSNAEWDGRWQLRVYRDIPPEYLKVLRRRDEV
jgi:hypothetical protein